MRHSLSRPAAGMLAAMTLVMMAACDTADPVSLQPGAPLLSAHDGGHDADGMNAATLQELAALRRLTAPFHDIETAMSAGYDTPVTDCLAHPTDGAMGVHYGDLALFDDVAELLSPETLIYEPRKNGGMRLVGVEYVIPFDALPATADPPELLGQHFHANEDAGVWGLHVWLWRNNPDGLFADWNPRVSCAWAD